MSNTDNRNRKASAGGILMRAAGILFALTAVTVWATSFLLAKFTTGGTSSNDARVAEFQVDATVTQGTITIDADNGGTGDYTITLTNLSETAVRTELKLDFSMINTRTGGALKTVTVKVGDTGTEKSYTLKNNQLTLDEKFALAPAGTTAATTDVKLTLSFEPYGAVVTDSETGDTTEIGISDTALLALTQPMKGLFGETDALPFDIFAIFTQID